MIFEAKCPTSIDLVTNNRLYMHKNDRRIDTIIQDINIFNQFYPNKVYVSINENE